MHLTEQEKQNIIECINLMIKSSNDAIATSLQLLPIVVKLRQPEPEEPLKTY